MGRNSNNNGQPGALSASIPVEIQRLIRSLEAKVASLQAKVDALSGEVSGKIGNTPADIAAISPKIRTELQASGSSPLSITKLPGIAAQPQIATLANASPLSQVPDGAIIQKNGQLYTYTSGKLSPVVASGNLTEATSHVLTVTGGTNAVLGTGTAIQVTKADSTHDGYLSSTDWTAFNSKPGSFTTGNLTEATSAVLTITGGTNAVIGTGVGVQVKQATATQSGYLSSTDWAAFNAKQGNITLPLSVANGGTGQTGAPAALTALGGAALTGNNTLTGANTFTNQIQVTQTANVPALMLTGATAGWASGLQLVNTTASTGRKYGIYSGSNSVLAFTDETAGATRAQITPTGNWIVGTGPDTGFLLQVNGGSTITGLQNGQLLNWQMPVGTATTGKTYYLLATLPTSSTATYDSLILRMIAGGWLGGQKTHIVYQFQNRNGFSYSYQVLSGVWPLIDVSVYAYQQTDGSTQIYAVITASTFATANISIELATNVTIVTSPTSTTTTPSGTLVFASDNPTTYPSNYISAGMKMYGPLDINGQTISGLAGAAYSGQVTFNAGMTATMVSPSSLVVSASSATVDIDAGANTTWARGYRVTTSAISAAQSGVFGVLGSSTASLQYAYFGVADSTNDPTGYNSTKTLKVDTSGNVTIQQGVTVSGYAVLAGQVAFTGPDSWCRNLVPDSDIKFGTAYWPRTSAGSLSIGHGIGGDGGNGFFLTGTGAASAFTYAGSAIINVVPGVQYTISGYIDASNVTSGAPSWILFDPTVATPYGSAVQTAGVKGRVLVSWICPVSVTQVVMLCDTNNCVIANTKTIVFSNPQLEVGPVPSIYRPNMFDDLSGQIILGPGGMNLNGQTVSGTATFTGSTTFSGAITATSISGLTTPLSITQGGTGANNATTARTNLGLGTAATQATTAFDAAGAATAAQTASLQKSSNLSDLANAVTARTNLGLGTAATQATTAFDAAGAASTAQAASLQKSSNLSDLANIVTARTNLGLATVANTGSYNDLLNKPTIAGQVNSDWNAVSGSAQILNKPVLGTAAAQNTTAFDAAGAATALLSSNNTWAGTQQFSNTVTVQQAQGLTVNGYTVLAGQVAFTGPQSFARNLVPDSDIKLGTAYWPRTSSPSMVIGHGMGGDGANAFYLVGTGAASGFVWAGTAIIQVIPGVQYTISGYIDATNVTAGNQPSWLLFDPTVTTPYGSATQTLGQKGRALTSWTCPVGVTQVVLLCDSNNCTIASGKNLIFSNPQLEIGPVPSLYRANWMDDLSGQIILGPGGMNLNAQTIAGSGTFSGGITFSGTVSLPAGTSAANMSSFPTLNQNTTGTAANVTGVVAISNGGTGQTTSTAALTALGGVNSTQAAAAAPVQSVFGRTGAVVANTGDYGSFYGALGSANTWTSNQILNGSLTVAGTTAPRQQLSVGSFLDLYSGAAVATSAAGIRASSANLILNPSPTGATYLNFDQGSGGVNFGNGASVIKATVDATGFATFDAAKFNTPANIAFGSNWQPWSIPSTTGLVSMVATLGAVTDAKYLRIGPFCYIRVQFSVTLSGTMSRGFNFSAPFASSSTAFLPITALVSQDNGNTLKPTNAYINPSSSTITLNTPDFSNFTGTAVVVYLNGMFPC